MNLAFTGVAESKMNPLNYNRYTYVLNDFGNSLSSNENKQARSKRKIITLGLITCPNATVDNIYLIGGVVSFTPEGGRII
ncbi:MAG: hypothetical protein P1P82_02460 [Bacteroidales bacterium]|nr:hypothetical protein [Bacteroidales bacterium]MDT8431093.1 hypothetical protein [Bacteroidales bacterium]